MAEFAAKFALGDEVLIDPGGANVMGTVTAFCWRIENPQVEVCWWNAGAHCSGWFPEWRLSKAQP